MKKKFFCLSHAGKSIQPTVEKTIILVFKHRLTVEKMIACSVGKLLVSNNLPSHQVLKKKPSPAHSEIASFRSPHPPLPSEFQLPSVGRTPWVPGVFFVVVVCGENWAARPLSSRSPPWIFSGTTHFHCPTFTFTGALKWSNTNFKI